MPQLFLVGLQPHRGRRVDEQIDLAMPTGRTDQLHQLVDQRGQIAIGAARGLRPAGSQKTPQVLFGQSQLAQGHGQAFAIDLPAMPLMQLHGNPRSGDMIAQMMGQSTAQLTEQRQALRTFDDSLHFVELAGQGVDRARSSRAARRHAAAAAVVRNRRWQSPDLPAQLRHRPAQAAGNRQGHETTGPKATRPTKSGG